MKHTSTRFVRRRAFYALSLVFFLGESTVANGVSPTLATSAAFFPFIQPSVTATIAALAYLHHGLERGAKQLEALAAKIEGFCKASKEYKNTNLNEVAEEWLLDSGIWSQVLVQESLRLHIHPTHHAGLLSKFVSSSRLKPKISFKVDRGVEIPFRSIKHINPGAIEARAAGIPMLYHVAFLHTLEHLNTELFTRNMEGVAKAQGRGIVVTLLKDYISTFEKANFIDCAVHQRSGAGVIAAVTTVVLPTSIFIINPTLCINDLYNMYYMMVMFQKWAATGTVPAIATFGPAQRWFERPETGRLPLVGIKAAKPGHPNKVVKSWPELQYWVDLGHPVNQSGLASSISVSAPPRVESALENNDDEAVSLVLQDIGAELGDMGEPSIPPPPALEDAGDVPVIPPPLPYGGALNPEDRRDFYPSR